MTEETSIMTHLDTIKGLAKQIQEDGAQIRKNSFVEETFGVVGSYDRKSDWKLNYKNAAKRVINTRVADFAPCGVWEPSNEALAILAQEWAVTDEDFLWDALAEEQDKIGVRLLSFIQKGLNNLTLDEIMTAGELWAVCGAALERHAKALAENLGVNDYAESEYEVMIEEGKLKTQNPDANF